MRELTRTQVRRALGTEGVSRPQQYRWRRRLICGLIVSGLFATAAGSVAARDRTFRTSSIETPRGNAC
jgi:hypothetical protein